MGVYNKTLVKAPYLFGLIGGGVTRCVVMALPSERVRGFLPSNLELDEQDVTPRGTHPVIFLFHSFALAQFSFPTFLEPMNYHEQNFGVPYTRVAPGRGLFGSLGPYYFMPRMFLDDWFVSSVGRFVWSFNKDFGNVKETEDRYTATNLKGQLLASLAWGGSRSEPGPALYSFPEFKPVRKMMDQPLITMGPVGFGPLLKLTDFDRNWNLTKVRPLRAVLEVGPDYLHGLDSGRFETAVESRDSAQEMLGCFEVSGPWWFSFPYPLPGTITPMPLSANRPSL